MINPSQKIGIWGFGIVGKSIARYLQEQGYQQISVMDKRQLTQEEIGFLERHSCSFFLQENCADFLEYNDIIIPSPGIDLRPYKKYQEKFLAELDLFYNAWARRAPIIAVTGTLGKTSVTHLLGQLLKKAGKKILIGGNIGTGMLDLVTYQDPVDYVLLELSSYQLEHSKSFAPDLAIWTNLYPKHLDRHSTVEEYFAAKSALVRLQNCGQQALILYELWDAIQALKPQGEIKTFSSHDSLSDYFLVGQSIAKKNTSIATTIPVHSFSTNWLIIAAALDMLGIESPDLLHVDTQLPEHRLQFVASVRGIEFYNDSKSTLMEATQAAVERLQAKPIILLLGGISDAGDRSEAVQQLAGKVTKIMCFGAEASRLAQICSAAAIDACAYDHLETAFYAASKCAQAGSCVLLSPGGPSFDLFKDYAERGKRFCQLVQAFQQDN